MLRAHNVEMPIWQQAGHLRTDIDVPTVGRFLLAVVLGTGMQAFFDPADWPRARIRATLNKALDDVRPTTQRRARHG